MITRQNLFILLLFLGALGVWRWYDSAPEPVDSQQAMYQPNFIAEKLTTRHYAANGLLRQTLQADRAEHYAQLDMTELTRPTVLTRDNDGQPQWQLSGENGVLNSNDNALLRHQVVLKYVGINPQVDQLTTDYLEMDLTNQQVRTNLKVEISGPGYHNQGTGLLAELDHHRYQLLSNSHATYFNTSVH